jgi:type IV secretory pathway VirB6-like protein
MIGELSLGGVFVPALLVLSVIALIITGLLTQLLQVVGVYRVVAYRPLVDLAIFVLVLGLIVLLTAPFGLPA